MDQNLYQHFSSLLDKTIAKRQNETRQIDEEYNALEQVLPAPGRPGMQHDVMVEKGLCSKAAKNEIKNRYCNLFPFDRNLVHLEKDDEYINASWIELPKDSGDNMKRKYLDLPEDRDQVREYVITMGPLHPSSYVRYVPKTKLPLMDTCTEFWNLCWMTGSRIIVMLCDVSPGFQGCSQYFPISFTPTFKSGPFRVTELEIIRHTDNYIEREFSVEKLGESGPDGGRESRRIRHLQFNTWPNYGVPEAVKPISEFIAHVYNRMKEFEKDDNSSLPQLYLPRHGNPNLLVHCSGGIGRSGTFLTAFHHYWHYMDMIDKKVPCPKTISNDPVFLNETVHFMRLQRHPWMVEGNHQYTLAYDIIIYLLKNEILPKSS